MIEGIKLIGFDVDDTLWHNMKYFIKSQKQTAAVLDMSFDDFTSALYKTEVSNMDIYGYGSKAYSLSLLETAARIKGGSLTDVHILSIVKIAKELMSHPLELLEGAVEAVRTASSLCRCVALTKGDIKEQERKFKLSGLEQYFESMEVLSDKQIGNYAGFLARYGVSPEEFLMVGDSLKSDIAPVLELGGKAVYIPCDTPWKYELADISPEESDNFRRCASLSEFKALLV